MKTHLHIFGLFLAASSAATAAVVMTAGPGWHRETDTINGGYFQDIDLDSDGSRDFWIWSAEGRGCFIVPTGLNRVLSLRVLPPESGREAYAFVGGELLGVSPTFGEWIGLEPGFADIGGALVYYCTGRGGVGQPQVCISSLPDLNQVRYYGLEFQSGGVLRYGWVSLSAPLLIQDHFVDVNSWAYETEPGHAIAAGTIPEPSTAAFIGGSAALLLHRNASNRKENKSAAANRWGLSVFIAWCKSKVQRVCYVFSRLTCR